jgi:hypothetical protein
MKERKDERANGVGEGLLGRTLGVLDAGCLTSLGDLQHLIEVQED